MSSPLSLPTGAAAALMALTLCIHVFMGGPEVHDAYQNADLNNGLKAFASILWHAVTVTLLVFAVALVVLARLPNPALEATLAAIQLGMAALFLWYGSTQLGTVWLMPQWVIFLAIPALTRFGQMGR